MTHSMARTIETLTAQNTRLEENTSQAASAASQLNAQLSEALAKALQLEAEKRDLGRQIDKLEDQVFHLQVNCKRWTSRPSLALLFKASRMIYYWNF